MSDSVPPPEKHVQPISTRTVLLGVLATAGLHVMVALVLSGVATVLGAIHGDDIGFAFMVAGFFIGVAQLPYMIPAWFIFRRRGWHGAALGLLIGASLTFLANSACFGLLMFNGIH